MLIVVVQYMVRYVLVCLTSPSTLPRNTVEGLCSPLGTFVNPEEFDEVPVTVECVASYTCDLLDNVVPATPGRFVCDYLSMPVDSQCHLVCDDGYLPEGPVHNTCTYDNVTESYVWSETDYAQFKCVAQIGVSESGRRERKKERRKERKNVLLQ